MKLGDMNFSPKDDEGAQEDESHGEFSSGGESLKQKKKYTKKSGPRKKRVGVRRG